MWSAINWLKHVEGERTTGKVSKHPWDVIIKTVHYKAILIIQTSERELPMTYHSSVIHMPFITITASALLNIDLADLNVPRV